MGRFIAQIMATCAHRAYWLAAIWAWRKRENAAAASTQGLAKGKQMGVLLNFAKSRPTAQGRRIFMVYFLPFWVSECSLITDGDILARGLFCYYIFEMTSCEYHRVVSEMSGCSIIPRAEGKLKLLTELMLRLGFGRSNCRGSVSARVSSRSEDSKTSFEIKVCQVSRSFRALDLCGRAPKPRACRNIIHARASARY